MVPLPGIAQKLLVQQMQSWQGPFPPPEAIKQYELVLPGTFDRMLKMAEEAQQAQVATTFRAQEFARLDTRRGHWLGFAATVVAMLGAILCAYLRQPWVAGLFLSVPVMSVAKALIESKRAIAPAIVVQPAEPPKP